jgi:hypothetical protein
LGYQFPFLFGTAFIFVSLWLTQKIDIERQRVPGAPGAPAVAHVAETALTKPDTALRLAEENP